MRTSSTLVNVSSVSNRPKASGLNPLRAARSGTPNPAVQMVTALGNSRPSRRLEQREPPAAALVAQPAGPLLDRFHAELLGVERPRPCQVPRRQAGGHVTVVKHA